MISAKSILFNKALKTGLENLTEIKSNSKRESRKTMESIFEKCSAITNFETCLLKSILKRAKKIKIKN